MVIITCCIHVNTIMVCGDDICCIHVNTIMICGDDICGGFDAAIYDVSVLGQLIVD